MTRSTTYTLSVMNQLQILYWKTRERIIRAFEPEDQFDRLIYRLEKINTAFLCDILSYNNITARVRTLRPSSRKLDNYLKWVVTMERDEKLNDVIAENAVESSVHLTDFFSDKGVLQDAVADFQVLKQSIVRFIRLYQTYALNEVVSYERDYFLRTMRGHLISTQHLIEDLYELSTNRVVGLRA